MIDSLIAHHLHHRPCFSATTHPTRKWLNPFSQTFAPTCVSAASFFRSQHGDRYPSVDPQVQAGHGTSFRWPRSRLKWLRLNRTLSYLKAPIKSINRAAENCCSVYHHKGKILIGLTLHHLPRDHQIPPKVHRASFPRGFQPSSHRILKNLHSRED